jgi:hypothetical protein
MDVYPDEILCRLIKLIGTRQLLRTYWGDKLCPNAWGTGKPGMHDASVKLKDIFGERIADWVDPSQFADEMWPTKCDRCDAPVPQDGNARKNRQVHQAHLFNNESGKPEPGDMYYAPWYHNDEFKPHYCRNWDNCNDPRGHLIVVVPTGDTWDLDGRANNCGSPEDRTHRCWVRNGIPPMLHVDKNGLTCSAGAGSISVPGYHGYLHNGVLKKC